MAVPPWESTQDLKHPIAISAQVILTGVVAALLLLAAGDVAVDGLVASEAVSVAAPAQGLALRLHPALSAPAD
jgi:hypothetical protein